MIEPSFARRPWFWLRTACVFALLMLAPALALAHGDAPRTNHVSHASPPAAESTPREEMAVLHAPAPCPNGGGACCCSRDCCGGPSPVRVLAAGFALLPLPSTQSAIIAECRADDSTRAARFALASIGARAPPARFLARFI